MKLMLSILLLILSGCETNSIEEKPEATKDKHIIYESQYYMEKNDIETWIEGKWIQTEGSISLLGLAPYVEFSFHNIKKQWVKFIRSEQNPIDIIESSYKIEENYWGLITHRLISWIHGDPYEPAIPLIKGLYIEIEKINEDKMKVYHRGYVANPLPPELDLSNPDPKLAVRTGGDQLYAIYQRVK